MSTLDKHLFPTDVFYEQPLAVRPIWSGKK